MTRCVEFYDYWDEHPDFCGKSPSTIANINSYAKVLNELKAHGIEKSFTIVNLPEGNARPLFPVKDPEIRTKIIRNIADWLLSNRKPSQKDVIAWVNQYTEKRPTCKIPEETSCELPYGKKEDVKTPEPPKPTPTPTTVAAVAHVPEERVIQTYTPPRPIERTDPDDKANGAVKRDWNAGNDIPDRIEIALTRRTKAVMRQMVLYEKSLDHYQAIDFIIQEGVAKYEDICEIECLKESAEA